MSSDADRLRALLEGLECRNVDRLMTEDPEKLRYLAERIAKAAKLGAPLLPPQDWDEC